MPKRMTPNYMPVVGQRADRPVVAASHNRDLSRIQEWCNHWGVILNPSH